MASHPHSNDETDGLDHPGKIQFQHASRQQEPFHPTFCVLPESSPGISLTNSLRRSFTGVF